MRAWGCSEVGEGVVSGVGVINGVGIPCTEEGVGQGDVRRARVTISNRGTPNVLGASVLCPGRGCCWAAISPTF